MSLSLVVESLAIVIHDNAVEMAPNDGVWFLRSSVNELAVCTVGGAGSGGSDFEGHL